MNRPQFIELPETNSRSASALSKNGLSSPRIQHFDGDVPPSLSPLDAIAARSRRLARELEETRKAGERRMSRLPPQIVTESLTEYQNNRPPIFRALSEGADAVPPLPIIHHHFDHPGAIPRVANPINRPTSSHVRMSAVPRPVSTPDVNEDGSRAPLAEGTKDYFGAPRVESPSPIESQFSQSFPQRTSSPQPNYHFEGSRQPSSSSHPDVSMNLAPPRTFSNRLQPYQDGSDDDYTSSNAGSTFSQSRKLSSSSGLSAPHSPISPYAHSHHRNPSSNSLGSPTRGSARNFSRPMSSSSMQNLRGETGGMNAMIAGHLRQASSFDGSNVPSGFMAGQASSYTHAIYSLPRGRNISDRTSGVFNGLAAPHFEWQEPMFPSSPTLESRKSHEAAIPSPRGSPRPSREDFERSGLSFELSSDRGKSAEAVRPSTSSTPSTFSPSKASAPTQPSTNNVPSVGNLNLSAALSPVEEMSLSSRSNSTVRPTTSRSTSTHHGLTTEEHVSKAIELHENGSLKESTYHLRIAANKGHPTGMLLYALACRHGWGMRANPKEGVQWLRKAVDSAMSEVADDEQSAGQKSTADIVEKKAHRAQFGLGIYELGMSHLNGWGTVVDKPLALRCFEIAGNWGDTDALTEAGYCYAQGIGCKKDMKKAAKFYRMAEAKGVSMIGNSWIHKEKYNDSNAETEKGSDRSRSTVKTSSDKPRSKSKPRGIFGRKKSVHS